MHITRFQDLRVYAATFELQQRLFEVTKSWPREETYALISQIRRSSRAVGANLAEGWAKRKYPAHFCAKLTDADGELQETLHWLATSHECAYLDDAEVRYFSERYQEAGRMLGTMMADPRKFCLR